MTAPTDTAASTNGCGAGAPPSGRSAAALAFSSMATTANWVDLLDPDEETLRRTWTNDLHQHALEALTKPVVHDDEPRPSLKAHGDYVFGVFLVPVVVPDEDRVYYQEVD